MAIAEGIAAIKATLELAKLTSDAVKRPNIDAADVQGKLHEMLIHAVNAQTALTDAQLEISDLRRRLDEHNTLSGIQDDLEMDPLCRYYVRKSEKDLGLVPYCPTCWGAERKLVPLTLVQHPGLFACALHKIRFYSPEHLESTRKQQEAEANRPRRTLTSDWMAR